MRTTRFTAVLAATALTGVLLTGGALSASAAPATEPAGTTCVAAQKVAAAWKALPTDLKDDIRSLKALPADQRPAAAREIKQGALAGDYGTTVQTRAKELVAKAATAVRSWPAALRSDVREMRAATGDARRDLRRQIADKALAGDYGDAVQQKAEQIKASDIWQGCGPSTK
jgi:hypothetical protein